MAREPDDPDRLIAQNRRASHDYFILDTVEAGLVLAGTEVKSLRQGKASLAEAYASIEHGEAWVLQLHIPPYEQGNRWNLEPTRRRKLLLHRTEIDKLEKSKVSLPKLAAVGDLHYWPLGLALLLLLLESALSAGPLLRWP